MRKILVGLIVGATFAAYTAYFRTPSKVASSATLSNSESSSSAQTVSTSNPTPSPIPSPGPSPTPVPTPQSGAMYKDGTYNGSVEDAFYGNLQVQVLVGGGRLSSVKFLQYPNDRDRSVEINTYAMPILSREAIDAQSASVDGVSGATDTSDAFVASLQTALSKAKV